LEWVARLRVLYNRLSPDDILGSDGRKPTTRQCCVTLGEAVKCCRLLLSAQPKVILKHTKSIILLALGFGGHGA
jgi:hypothetical protein